MIIKDSKGMFTFEVDKHRRVVKETPEGLFTKEDIERYHDDYVNKVMPALGSGKPWSNISDLRNYKTSSVVEELQKHVLWKVSNGLTRAAIVVGSAIVNMQMKRTGGTAIEPKPFETLEEADQWLQEQGY